MHAQLCNQLECSRATLNRLLGELRTLGAPLLYDREHGGYRYDHKDTFELPGFWINAVELQALLTMEILLDQTESGPLTTLLVPIKSRITAVLNAHGLSADAQARRIRLVRIASRGGGPAFQAVADAVMQRKRLAINYFVRQRDEHTERIVSPQRLVHYRDNWYLDGWCHTRAALRSFALDAIREARLCDEPARDIDTATLDAHYASAYGIFAGTPTAWAVLRFSPMRARWLIAERWHAEQRGRVLDDGRYELSLPYADSRELVMDILKYGPDVEVVSPEELRREVAARLAAAVRLYENGDG
jgi:predicted DNA-binding transcriptional regulator YafY